MVRSKRSQDGSIDNMSITVFSGKNKLSTFSIQIILSISENNSTIYLIKIKTAARTF